MRKTIKNILDKYECKYEECIFVGKYGLDFVVDGKLVVECDDLKYSSDMVLMKKFFKEKKEALEKEGYQFLFFREDEIREKPDIIESIIINKLGHSKKVGARKTSFKAGGDKAFFQENHLMGKGSGRVYFLEHEGTPVSAMQVKCKKDGAIEISRFCHKKGYSIIGGFTKLLNNIIKLENPSSVITFTDLRYGNGNYLKEFGFVKKTECLSFKWTDFEKTYHRMNFRGNTGLDHGLFRVWDCGQRKWVFHIEQSP